MFPGRNKPTGCKDKQNLPRRGLGCSHPGDTPGTAPGTAPGLAPPGPPSAAKPGSAVVIFLPELNPSLCRFAGTRGLCKSLGWKGNPAPGSAGVKYPFLERRQSPARVGEGAPGTSTGGSGSDGDPELILGRPPHRHRGVGAHRAGIWVLTGPGFGCSNSLSLGAQRA